MMRNLLEASVLEATGWLPLMAGWIGGRSPVSG
jgi:hypothetical protein